MKIEKNLQEYLFSEKFDKEFHFNITESRIIPSRREEIIRNKIVNKSVLHIGCADHLGVIENKIKDGLWLHDIITKNSIRSLGIDINCETIDYIKNTYHYDNVICADITGPIIKEIKSQKWDYVIFGEIIEHLDNPGFFLSEFSKKYGDQVKEFIISVPNILNLARYRFMKRGKEIINSDHRFWFTPYTILKILASANYGSEDIIFVNLSRLSISELINRKIRRLFKKKKYYPFFYFNTLLVSGKVKNQYRDAPGN